MSPKTIAKISLPFLLFTGLLFIYIHNLSRSVYGGDVGDLVTAAAVFGIPHPPGYPLFTLLGYFLIHLFPFTTPAFAVGIISAVSSATAVTVFYLLLYHITRNRLISLITALILAFFYLFWLYAEVAEVFALNTCFAIVLLYLAVIFRDTRKKGYLYSLAFLSGIAFTHHQTVILIFPALLLIVWTNLWSIRFQYKQLSVLLSTCFLFFFSSFLIYLYAPLASSFHPVVDWAHITDFQSLLDLILRKRYGTFSAGSFPVTSILEKIVILKTYWFNMISQLTLPVVLFSLIGVVVLWKKDRNLCIAGLLGLIISGPLFILYAGFPLSSTFFFSVAERFTILSTIFILLFFPFGLQAFSKFLVTFFSKAQYQHLFEGIFLLIPLMLFFYNFPKTNLSSIMVGDQLGENFLVSLPKNSVVFLTGDTTLFNPWYVRYARGYRKDVDVFNLNDMKNNILLQQIAKEKIGKNSKISDRKVLSEVMELLDKKRPVFLHLPIQFHKTNPVKWVPHGLVYEYRNKDEIPVSIEAFKKKTEAIYNEIAFPDFRRIRHVALGNVTLADIPEYYLQSFITNGSYYLSEYKDADSAISFYEKSILLDVEFAQGYAAIAAVYLTEKRDCKSAIPYFEKALVYNPQKQSYFLLLYMSYKTCNESGEKLTQLQKKYTELFKASLVKDLQKNLKKND